MSTIRERCQAALDRCKGATPGPWRWMEDHFNERIAPFGKSGKRRPRIGKRLTDLWVYLLVGAPHCPCGDDSTRDAYDYPHVAGLQWWAIKGRELVNAAPNQENAAFIAAARTDVEDFAAALLRVTGPEMRQACEEIAYYDGQVELLMQAIARIAEGKGGTP